MEKQIIIGIIISLLIICFNGCIEQDSDSALTVAELYERENKPGDTIEFKGTIRDSTELNLSYGHYIILYPDKYIKYIEGTSNDMSEAFTLIKSDDINYDVGEKFRVTLHFTDYQFNGRRFVQPQECFGTFPTIPLAYQVALMAASYSTGFEFILNEIDHDGYGTYELIQTNLTQNYSLNKVNISLQKARQNTSDSLHDIVSQITFFAEDYVSAAVYYVDEEKIDHIYNLTNKNSIGGHINFNDNNFNNYVDSNDTIKLFIPPTPDESHIETYMLRLIYTEDNLEKKIIGYMYIINWFKGPYMFVDESFENNYDL